MIQEIYTKDGAKSSNKITLAENVFGVQEVNRQLIFDAIRCELANKRQGTASTKEKSTVHGTGKKPWRQKGTGRARAGSRTSNVFKGGAVAFGPLPRDYSYKLPKKQKRNSLKNILSYKAQKGMVKVVEDFTLENGKTKEAFEIMKALTSCVRVVLVYKEDNAVFKRAFRNIPWIKTLSYKRLAAHDLFYAREIVILKSAAEELESFYK